MAKNKKGQSPEVASTSEGEDYGKMTQWTSPEGERFFPAGSVEQDLPPGVYDIKENPHQGLYFEKINVNTQDLLRFPDSMQDAIIAEIQTFWEKKDKFKNREDKAKIRYKRGICLYGPPGSGKTCLVQLIVNDVISRGGVCIVFGHPRLFVSGMRIFRQIHKDKKIVVLMEDVDSILEQYDESDVLNVLDGVNSFEDVVFLATTNYPEKLGPRIINRPSRFDKRFQIDHPNPESREMYLRSLLTEAEIKENNIDVKKWVEDTEKFSMAHLKELFIAVVILGDDYEKALVTLREMKEPISSEDDRTSVGFGGN